MINLGRKTVIPPGFLDTKELDNKLTTVNEQLADTETDLEQRGVNVVKKFGAKGDGTTDNLQALINMINFVNSTGGNIDLLFPKGDYLFGAAVGIPDITVPNVRFRGVHRDNVKLKLTSGTYFKPFGGGAILRGFSIMSMTIQYDVADTVNPTMRSRKFTGHMIEDIRYDGGCTFIEMGTPTEMSYALRMRRVDGVIANAGQPFIRLVNGAGFYWDTFDSIYHKQAAAPVFNTTSVMNTVPGTNAVDIVGDWDSVEMSVFAEKMYRVINIDGVDGTVVFNVRLKNSVCDYIRDSVIYADMKTSSTSLNTVSVDNVYGATWEGHGFYFRANTADVRNITFNNVITVFTGKSAVYLDAISAGARKWAFANCRFLGTSRYDNTFEAVFIGLVGNLIMTGNRIGGNDISGSISWGADKGLKIVNAISECNITGNIAEGYDFIAPSGSPVSANASKLRRIHGNVMRGTISTRNYAGLQTTAPFTRPASDVDWYNVSAFDVEVYIGGAGITAIKKNGTLLPYTQGLIVLEPGEYYSITYTDSTTSKVTYFTKQ